MDSFLTDIGVHAITPEQLLDGSKTASAVGERLAQEIVKTRSHAAALFAKHLPGLEAVQERVNGLQAEAEAVGEALTAAEEQQKAAEANLQRQQQIDADLLDLTSQQQTHAYALDRLQSRHHCILELENGLKRQDWPFAVDLLLSTQSTTLEDAEWLQKSAYMRKLGEWLTSLDTQLREEMIKVVKSSISFDEATPSITVDSESSSIELEALFATAEKLRISQSYTRNLLEGILEDMVKPYLRGTASFSSDSKTLRLEKDHPESIKLETLPIFTQFLSQRLPSMYKTIEPILLQSIVNILLEPALPDTPSSDAIAKFQQTLDRALAFEQSLDDSPTIIKDWAVNTTTHWLTKYNTNIALRVRNLVKGFGDSKGWESTSVEWIVPTQKGVTASSLLVLAFSLLSKDSAQQTKDTERQQSAPSSTKTSPVLDEEDAWGLDASPKINSPPSNIETTSPDLELIDDDGWGISDSLSPPTSPVKDRSRGKGRADPTEMDVDVEEDAWGFVDETPADPVEMPTSELETKWEWDDQQNSAKSATESEVHTSRPRGKRKLGATPLAVAQAQALKEKEEKARAEADLLQQRKVEQTRKRSESKAKPTEKKEHIAVSNRTRLLFDLASEVASASNELSSDFDNTFHSDPTLPLKLQRTTLDLFDFFRATMPVAYGLILQVPALSMQYANDLEWLASKLLDLLETSRESWSTDKVQEAQSTGISLLRNASEQRTIQINAQRASLFDSLSDTEHFESIIENARFAVCQRAVRQVVHTLQRFGQVLQPVANSTLRYAILGDLVKDVLQYVMHEIENQLDIGEEESKRLNAICKMLHDLESLFMVGTESLIDVYVGQLWFKFAYLSEILDASMVDIMFLVEEGNLVDFTSTELVKLVKALFSDSPTRQRNIEKIISTMQ